MSSSSRPFIWRMWAVLWVALTTIASVPLSANEKESPTQQISERTKNLYSQAAKSFEQGNFEKAAVLFRKMYDEHKISAILYEIAQAEAANKKHGRALEMYKRYLEQEKDIPVDQKMAVYQAIGLLQKNVAYIQVVAAPHCTITVNDFPRGKTPLTRPISVSANVVQIVNVFCQNQQVHEGKFILESGVMKQVDITDQIEKNEQSKNMLSKEIQGDSIQFTEKGIILSNYHYGAKTFLIAGLLSAGYATVNLFIPKKYNEPYLTLINWTTSGIFLGTSMAFYIARNKIKKRHSQSAISSMNSTEYAKYLQRNMNMYKLFSIELYVLGGALICVGTGISISESNDWAQMAIAVGAASVFAAIVPTTAYFKNKKELSTLQKEKDISLVPSLFPMHNGGGFVLGGTF